jgi:hypothetical protein
MHLDRIYASYMCVCVHIGVHRHRGIVHDRAQSITECRCVRARTFRKLVLLRCVFGGVQRPRFFFPGEGPTQGAGSDGLLFQESAPMGFHK